MKKIKESRTKNKIYICRKCGDIYDPKLNYCTVTDCQHDWILQPKEATKCQT